MLVHMLLTSINAGIYADPYVGISFTGDLQ